MQNAHLKRRLTAILLADIVGYSRLMSIDEEGTHSRFTGYLNDLIEPKILEYGGRQVRSMGDGLLVEFDSAINAVRCGLDLQQDLAERDAAATPDRRIRLRIGINTGDVIVNDRDIYGNSINIAARLEALAGAGEVYLTQAVHEQLRNVPGLSFSDRGEYRVKNIDHPIRSLPRRIRAKPRRDDTGLEDRRTLASVLACANATGVACHCGGRRDPDHGVLVANRGVELAGVYRFRAALVDCRPAVSQFERRYRR